MVSQNFPEVKVNPKVGGVGGNINQTTLLKRYGDLVFHNVVKKNLNYICVKTVGHLQGKQVLNGGIRSLLVKKYIHHGEYCINLPSLSDVESPPLCYSLKYLGCKIE